MTAPSMQALAALAHDIRAGALRDIIDSLIEMHGIADEHLRDVLRAIARGAEAACDDACANRAIEIEELARGEAQ